VGKKPQKDEFFQFLTRETTSIILNGNTEERNKLSSGQILVIPKGVSPALNHLKVLKS